MLIIAGELRTWVAFKDDSMLVWRKNWLSRAVSKKSSGSEATTHRRSLWTGAGWACLIAVAGIAVGCKTPEGEPELKYLGKDRDLQYYREVSSKIDYPDVAQDSPEEVTHATEPRRLKHPSKEDVWNIGLDEVLRTALQNAEVIKDSASFLSPGNRLLNNPDFTQSVHDIAIQDTNTLFGQGGVEAALAEFDANFTTNMMWGRAEQPSESNTIGYAAFDGQTEEFGDFRSSLSKIFANGSQMTLAHNWFYSGQNQGVGGRPFDSQFTSRAGRGADAGLPTLLAEVRTPLWAGAGTEYTRIAGPIARRPTLQSTPNVNQGVVIARIRTDISIADFEEAVANLLKDAEEVYWDLALAYRTYDAEMQSQNSALQTWREVRANMEAGKVGAADEAQARDNYYEISARAKNALSGLYQNELRLRRLMGLPVNDGRIMRPIEDPITAELNSDWNVSLTEALTLRPELRKQKWNIKSLELQYEAAQSLIRPRLDFVARYDVNGFGDRLTGNNGSTGNARFKSAYDTLFSGDYTGWGLGFEFSMPLGFRGAHAQVKNYEHRLAKARAILANQEIEVSHELAATMQQVDQAYEGAKTNFNRRRAAERRVQAFEAEYRVGRTTLDQLLRSQISLAQAEIAYFQSLIGYNKALADLKFRKGTILRDDQVYLSEGMWDTEAYGQAVRKAWARSFAFDAPRKSTEPFEFAIDGDDVVLSAQPAEWRGYAEPLPTGTPPAVPAPSGDAPKPDQPKTDNRSADALSEDAVGSLRDTINEEFIPPSKKETGDVPMPPPALPSSLVPSLPQGLVPESIRSEESSFVPPAKSKNEEVFGDDLFTEPLKTSQSSRNALLNPTRRALQSRADEFAQPINTSSPQGSPIRRHTSSSAIQQTGARNVTDETEQAEFIAPVRK